MNTGSAFCILNGKTVKSSRTTVSLTNRLFRYGDGVFETMHWHQGQILFDKDHLSRLIKGMKLLALPVPDSFNSKELNAMTEKLIKACKIEQDARIRLQVWREVDGTDGSAHPIQSSYAVSVTPLTATGYKINRKGLRIGIYPQPLLYPSVLSAIKSCNRLPYILAGLYAKKHGLDDTLLLNHRKQVTEATSSNVFIVSNNGIITPPIESGCIEGVMRMNLIKVAGILKIPVSEKKLTADDLLKAEEIFLTNVIRGIQCVSLINGIKKKSDKTILLAGKLQKKLSSLH